MLDIITTIETYAIESGNEPIKLEPLIRELDINLNKKAKLDEDIAGRIYKSDGEYYIDINKTEHYFRQRFTMSHELGHYVLHKDIIDQEDGAIEDTVMYRSPNNAKSIDLSKEQEANQFAISILMPLEHVKKDYDSMKDVKEVAKKWQVSPLAIKIRLGLKK